MAVQSKYGGLKIVWHPEKLKAIREGKITSPLYVRLKPTNKCNHHCYYCSYEPDFGDIRKPSRLDEIPKEKIMEILGDFKDMGVKAVTLSGGGEPLIYPHIEEVLKKILEYGIDLSMITNGQRLNGERAELLKNAKWVRISSDSCNAKMFSDTRGVPESWFNELVENIKNFAKIKNPDCELGVNIVVQEKNAECIYDAIKFFKDLGVDHVKLTPRHVPDKFEEYHKDSINKVKEQINKAREAFPDFDIYDTYDIDFTLTEKKERQYSRCYMMQIIPAIGADCKVYFCHDKAYSETGSLGSIKDQSFKQLWFSEEAAEKFKNYNPKIGCKHHCVYDSRNIFINDAIGCYGGHVNFI